MYIYIYICVYIYTCYMRIYTYYIRNIAIYCAYGLSFRASFAVWLMILLRGACRFHFSLTVKFQAKYTGLAATTCETLANFQVSPKP